MNGPSQLPGLPSMQYSGQVPIPLMEDSPVSIFLSQKYNGEQTGKKPVFPLIWVEGHQWIRGGDIDPYPNVGGY